MVLDGFMQEARALEFLRKFTYKKNSQNQN